jgi:nucleotide-binding universal stress UspA family protein
VTLTERAHRSQRDGFLTVALRRLRAPKRSPQPRSVSGVLARAPIIMVAIDLAPEAADLSDALSIAVRRVLATEPDARLACVNVLRTSRIGLDPLVDEQGRNPHLQRLVELKHWARTLPVAPERITYHVFESVDPASALIDYARNTRIDHIIIGARGSSPMRRLLGSVSAKVVAEAPCTVTVVRTRDRSSSAKTG